MKYIYYVVIHTGEIISAHKTRHAAIGAKKKYHDCNDYHIEVCSVLSRFWADVKRSRNSEFDKLLDGRLKP